MTLFHNFLLEALHESEHLGLLPGWDNNAVGTAKLDDVNFHTLRHTFASWAVMRGVTLKELQELLGHASLAMTMRYAHLAPEHLRTAVSRLEGLTGSQPASASAQTSAQEPVESVGASQN